MTQALLGVRDRKQGRGPVLPRMRHRLRTGGGRRRWRGRERRQCLRRVRVPEQAGHSLLRQLRHEPRRAIGRSGRDGGYPREQRFRGPRPATDLVSVVRDRGAVSAGTHRSLGAVRGSPSSRHPRSRCRDRAAPAACAGRRARRDDGLVPEPGATEPGTAHRRRRRRRARRGRSRRVALHGQVRSLAGAARGGVGAGRHRARRRAVGRCRAVADHHRGSIAVERGGDQRRAAPRRRRRQRRPARWERRRPPRRRCRSWAIPRSRAPRPRPSASPRRRSARRPRATRPSAKPRPRPRPSRAPPPSRRRPPRSAPSRKRRRASAPRTRSERGRARRRRRARRSRAAARRARDLRRPGPHRRSGLPVAPVRAARARQRSRLSPAA